MMDTELTKSYKLENKHFDKFKEYFDFWVAEFGLNGWEVAYFFRKTEDGDEDARASVHWDPDSRIVVCCLNKEWVGSEPTNKNLARCAYHEVVELLLGRLNELLRYKAAIADSTITEEIHRLIRIFENVHFEMTLFFR